MALCRRSGVRASHDSRSRSGSNRPVESFHRQRISASGNVSLIACEDVLRAAVLGDPLVDEDAGHQPTRWLFGAMAPEPRSGHGRGMSALLMLIL